MIRSATTAWSKVRLADVGDTLIGLTYEPRSVSRSGTLVLRSSNIQDGRLAFDDNVFVDCAIPDRIRIREQDILICVRNGSRRLIGKSVILDRRVVGQTFGAFMAIFRSEANPYLRYFFQSDDFKHQVDKHLGATINQITNGSLKSFAVELPQPAEQAEIVERLNDADGLIVAIQRVIAKKEATKEGMMQQLLTGKTRLPGFAQPWGEAVLGDLAHIKSGGTPKSSVPTYWDGGIPWCTPTDITREKGRHLRATDRTISAEGLDKSGAQLLPKGSLLLCTRATIGQVKIAMGPIATNQGFKSLVPQVGVSSEFLYYKMLTLKAELTSAGTGSTFLEVSKRDVSRLCFKTPDSEEQEAIAVVLTDVDDEVDALYAHLKKAKAIRKGMMQELLTGRIRLPLVDEAQHE